MTDCRHFLDLRDFSKKTLEGILSCASSCRETGDSDELTGKRIALLFEEASTRTRVSFDVGVHSLGGSPVILDSQAMQISKGETIEDTVRVLSRYVDGIVIRSLDHEKVLKLSAFADVPVINALTKESHPCQLIADLLTVTDKQGSLDGLVFGWFGDVCNVTNSWIDASVIFGFELRVVVPRGFGYEEQVSARSGGLGGSVKVYHDVREAALGLDVVVTDTWSSLGEEVNSKEELEQKFGDYRVDKELMSMTNEGSIFLHCLPAYRGYEVSGEVIDGVRSVVWDEAENRLHAHKGILLYCFGMVG